MLSFAASIAFALVLSWLLLRIISRIVDRRAMRLEGATVLSAETIHADGRTIRLWGIQASSASHEDLGLCSNALDRMIHGQPLVCHQVGQDEEGNAVACVMIATKKRPDVGLAMIASGHARASVDAPGHYLRAERRARRCGLGIWAKEAIAARGYRQHRPSPVS